MKLNYEKKKTKEKMINGFQELINKKEHELMKNPRAKKIHNEI